MVMATGPLLFLISLTQILKTSSASAQWNNIIAPIFFFFTLMQQSALSSTDNSFKKIPVTKKLLWEQDDLSRQCFFLYDKKITIRGEEQEERRHVSLLK